MALESEVNFKAAVALAAAQLQVCWKDTVLAALANDVKNPMHPLRQLPQLFTLDADAGTVVANDDYIAAAFAGDWHYKGAGMNDIGAPLAMAVVSAAVADADPSDIVLTMNQNVSLAEAMTVAGAVTTEKTISSLSFVGAVITIVVSSPYINGDTISVSGTVHGTALNQIILAAEAVTNNVA